MTAVVEAELRHWPIRIRELTLLRREVVTPGMLRVTLGGPNHVGFESHVADEHVKLLFPDASGELRVPTQDGDTLAWPRPMPVNRDYTVRRYDPVTGEVDIDVVVHTHGVATRWAQDAALGSTVWVAGPPRGIVVPDAFTWQAYVGDETALPAIARRVAELPRTMRGVVIVEVADADEEQPLDAPEGMTVRWLHRDTMAGGAAPGVRPLLGDAVAQVQIPRDGTAYVWAAGETGALKPVRRWARAAGLGKHQHDVTGYWKRGVEGDDDINAGVLHRLAHKLHLPH